MLSNSLLKTRHYWIKVYGAHTIRTCESYYITDLHLFETSRTVLHALFLSKFDAKLRNWPARKIKKGCSLFCVVVWWNKLWLYSCSSCTEKAWLRGQTKVTNWLFEHRRHSSPQPRMLVDSSTAVMSCWGWADTPWVPTISTTSCMKIIACVRGCGGDGQLEVTWFVAYNLGLRLNDLGEAHQLRPRRCCWGFYPVNHGYKTLYYVYTTSQRQYF